MPNIAQVRAIGEAGGAHRRGVGDELALALLAHHQDRPPLTQNVRGETAELTVVSLAQPNANPLITSCMCACLSK
jgi:hypothetical protein